MQSIEALSRRVAVTVKTASSDQTFSMRQELQSPSSKVQERLSAQQSQALKHQVLFGSSFEPGHPPLTYQHVRDIDDPLIGKIQEYKFSNGMRFFGVQNDTVPLVSFGEVHQVGAAHETDELDGMSHFLEHMFFQGSEGMPPGEFTRRMTATGGGINAQTGHDRTSYFVYNAPSEALPGIIQTRAQFIQRPTFLDPQLAKEAGVVVNEIKMYHSMPAYSRDSGIEALLWDGSGYRRTVLGPEENIRRFTREQMVNYYRQHYGPHNRSIIAVGDFDLAKTLDMVANEYNLPHPEPEKPYTVPTYLPRVLPQGTTHLDVTRQMKMALLGVAFNGPATTDTDQEAKDRVALRLVSNVLGSGKTSRLYDTLVEQSGLASNVNTMFYRARKKSALSIAVDTTPAQAQDTVATVRRELKRLYEEGITQPELDKARKHYRRDLSNYADRQVYRFMLTVNAVAAERPEVTNGFGVEIANQLTVAEVNDTIKRYLAPEKAVSVLVRPMPEMPSPTSGNPTPNLGSVAFAGRERLTRSKSFTPRFSGTLHPDLDQNAVLPSGTELIVRTLPFSPRTHITMELRGGQWVAQHPGEAKVLAKVLERGTATTPYKSFQAKIDDEAMNYRVTANPDSLTIQLSGDAQDPRALYDLAKEIIHAGPPLDDSTLAKVKEQTRRSVNAQYEENPDDLAFDMAHQALFPGHPYGPKDLAMLDVLDQLSGNDLKARFDQMAQPQNMTISVATPATLATLQPEVEGWLAPRVNQGPAVAQLPNPPLSALDRDVIITHDPGQTVEEMSSTEIVRAMRGISLSDQDQATLAVMNNIVGGGLDSRLFKAFREGKEGLCYSVRERTDSMLHHGALYWTIGTEHKNVPVVLSMFQQEMKAMRDGLVSDHELDSAKRLWKARFYAKHEAPEDQARTTAAHRSLGIDSALDLGPKIEAVTVQDIQRLAQRLYLQPSVTVVVAPKDALAQNQLPVNDRTEVDWNDYQSQHLPA